MQIELINISKQFEQEQILNLVNYTFDMPSSTVLLGINGSGKSTLLQIIAGYMNASKGEIIFKKNDSKIEHEKMYEYISFCAPYLELIEEFTLNEFLHYHFSFKKPMIPIHDIISHIGLNAVQDKQIEKFSSGMKQRVKLAQSILADTPLLLLDEPCTNLDIEGIELYNNLIDKFTHNKIVIVASNDPQEYDFCKQRIHIQNYKQEFLKR